MEGTYDVLLGSVKMGDVTVGKQGLYWHFACRCTLSGDTMQELFLTMEGKKHKLGLLTPSDGFFALETKVAAKKLGQGTPAFSLQSRHSDLKGRFVPLYPQEPFRYLQKLEGAYLARQSGQLGIIVPQEK